MENQKANVAAMRADVTADTTQIAHKILRFCLLQLHPASLQLLLHAGLHARALSVFNLAFLWPSSHSAYWWPTKTCESCSCDCYALAAVHGTRGVSGRRALKQACNLGWVLAQACPHRQCSAQGRLQGGQGGGVPPGCSCCGWPDSVQGAGLCRCQGGWHMVSACIHQAEHHGHGALLWGCALKQTLPDT